MLGHQTAWTVRYYSVDSEYSTKPGEVLVLLENTVKKPKEAVYTIIFL